MNREVIIDGKGSDWFEKAVFTLKVNRGVPNSKNLFIYAEELVEASLKNKTMRANSNDNIKSNVDAQKANDTYINQLKLKAISNQKLKNRADRLQRIIDIFLYTTLTFCFICVMCLLIKVLL